MTSALSLTIGVSAFALTFFEKSHININNTPSVSALSIIPNTQSSVPSKPNTPLYMAIPYDQLNSKLQSIDSEIDQITIGSKTVSIPSATINGWVAVKTNDSQTIAYLTVDPALVKTNILSLVNQNLITPVNEVIVTEDGAQTITTPGAAGTALANPDLLSSQIIAAANNILSGQGFQLNAPIVSVPAATTTLASLGKVLDVNLTTKRMYAYDNGQLVNTFLITAGKPTTPTPIGVFHIWEKLPMQTMHGYNPDGSTYVQPNVKWVNYFDHSGDAVHGNYWRPTSYFGNINSSHGCVSLQDTQAEWVYDWAPIGTTVITHN
jgi:lipoprotein-anchoring transpeptidase ErfK/SrfK